jgi:LEA14-like dessication related protein
MSFNKLFLAFGFLFLMACSEPKPFVFKGLKSIKIEKPGFGKNIFNAQFEYQNPNNFELTLKKLDCSIYINDQLLTQYKLDSLYVIPANADFVLPAKMEIELNLLLKNTVDILFNKPMKVGVKGTAILSKGMFTKTIPIEFETTQKLNLKDVL